MVKPEALSINNLREVVTNIRSDEVVLTTSLIGPSSLSESWIVVGEPYWRQEPEEQYLEAIGEERSTYGTHYENVEAGDEYGLELAYTLVSSLDDWDRYEGLKWYAAEEWASENPQDPGVEEVLKRVRKNKAAYVRWGRETMGWAIYVFRKRGSGTS